MFDKERTNRINALWQEGRTIKEINDEFNLITVLPVHLETVTKNTPLNFNRRLPHKGKIIVSRLAASGFFIINEGKESTHSLKYSSFKFLEECK